MNTIKETIMRHPFFQGMRAEHVDLLAQDAVEKTFETGDILFLQEEPAADFYLLESGRVAIEAHEPADGTTQVQVVETGDVVGWSWLFPPFVWHFQARALQPTRVVVLNGGRLLVEAERDPEFGFELMKRIAQVVIRRLQATRTQLLRTELEGALRD